MSGISPIGDRLDRLPTSRFHWRMLGLIGAGMFFDGFDIYLAAGVLGALLRDGMSTVQSNAMFISATFFGMMIGAWASGVLGDRYGRRFSYQFNLAVFGLASLCAVFAPSMTSLTVFRFFMGLGLGAEIVVGYGTLSEFMPPAVRGKFAALMNLCTNSALLVATFGGWLIIPYLGWRWMFAIAGVGAGLVWLMRKNMPESPRWLESKGRYAEADAITRRIEREVLGYETSPQTNERPREPVIKVPLKELFTTALLTRTVTGIVINVVNNLITHGFIGWMPTFLVKQGNTVATSLAFTTVMTLGAPVGSLLGFALSENVGRKRGIVIFSFVALVLGLLYPQMSHPAALMAVGFGLVVTIFILGSLSIAAYVPELFPTEIRMRGVGLCSTIGRMSNIAIPFAIASLFGSYGLMGVLCLISAGLLVQGVVVAILGVETTGRKLEEVDAKETVLTANAPQSV